jgi:hypothetical protein
MSHTPATSTSIAKLEFFQEYLKDRRTSEIPEIVEEASRVHGLVDRILKSSNAYVIAQAYDAVPVYLANAKDNPESAWSHLSERITTIVEVNLGV